MPDSFEFFRLFIHPWWSFKLHPRPLKTKIIWLKQKNVQMYLIFSGTVPLSNNYKSGSFLPDELKTNITSIYLIKSILGPSPECWIWNSIGLQPEAKLNKYSSAKDFTIKIGIVARSSSADIELGLCTVENPTRRQLCANQASLATCFPS